MLSLLDLEALGSKFVFPFNGGITEFRGVYPRNLGLDTLLLDWKLSSLSQSVELKPVGFAVSVLNDSQCMLEICRILKGLCLTAWHSLLA